MSTGIIDLKYALQDISGIGALTMRYSDGGRMQVFVIEGREVSVPTGEKDIAAAIRRGLEKSA